MKKNILYIASFVAAVCMSFSASAQILERNDMLYNSRLLPQANNLNPAFFQDNRSGYFALPNFNINFGMPISYSDLEFSKGLNDEGKTVYKIDIKRMADKLDENKAIHFGFNANILGFGFHVGKMFFTFNASAVANVGVYFPGGVGKTLGEGLLDRTSATSHDAIIDCEEFLNAIGYERISIGAGYEVNDRLTVGAHVNVLNGVANFDLRDVKIDAYYNDDNFSGITGTMDYRLRRGGAVNFTIDEDFKPSDIEFSHSFDNTGFTFDLGALYRFDKLTVSASVLDLGPGIHWKQNVYFTEPTKTSVQLEGLDISGLIDGGSIEAGFFDDVMDSLASMIKTKDYATEDYYFSVPTKIYLGANYDFNKLFRASLLFHGEWDKGLFTKSEGSDLGHGHFRYNTSLSGNLNLGNWLELMVSNAVCFDGEKGSFFNPGAGFVVAPGNSVQFFLMADYISSFYVVDMKAFNLQFGMNVVFGKNRRKAKEQTSDDLPVINDSNPESAENGFSGESIESAPVSTPDPTNATASANPIVF